MMLPEDDVPGVLENGWGEAHPLVPLGEAPPTLVMIYGPRDEGELDVILTLLAASHQFARGA